MRVNYAGEIAAQGLYLGAYLMENKPHLERFYLHAVDEEFVHLVWCGDRVYAQGGKVSVFNPLWFSGAFALGACSRIAGAGYALGFVQETETQVLRHIENHIDRMPKEDIKSLSVLKKMREDEQAHGNHAASLGAKELPQVVKKGMAELGNVLTQLSAWGYNE